MISGRLLGFHLSNIDRVRLRVILPQITQIAQRNAASCIISQRKTISLRLMLFCCLLFVVCLRKSARSAEDIGVSSMYID